MSRQGLSCLSLGVIQAPLLGTMDELLKSKLCCDIGRAGRGRGGGRPGSRGTPALAAALAWQPSPGVSEPRGSAWPCPEELHPAGGEAGPRMPVGGSGDPGPSPAAAAGPGDSDDSCSPSLLPGVWKGSLVLVTRLPCGVFPLVFPSRSVHCTQPQLHVRTFSP